MITLCPYCDYQYSDEPLSLDILRVIADPELPAEDYMLWIERLLRVQGLKSYNGVKIHIGRKHKDVPNWVRHELSPREAEVLNGN